MNKSLCSVKASDPIENSEQAESVQEDCINPL